MNNSPIIILDDDPDEVILVQEALNAIKLERKVFYFLTSNQLLEFLRTTDVVPFLIICDVRLTQETAFDVKNHVNKYFGLTNQSVPFVFWSSIALPERQQQLFDLTSQGFFIKPPAFDALCDTLEIIIKYWELSRHLLTVGK